MALNIECNSNENDLYKLSCTFDKISYQQSVSGPSLHSDKKAGKLVEYGKGAEATWNFILREAQTSGKEYCHAMGHNSFIRVNPLQRTPVQSDPKKSVLSINFTIECGPKNPSSATRHYQRFAANAHDFLSSRKGA